MSAPVVLDTNVVSELLRVAPAETVLAWMAVHGGGSLLTSITRAELRFGVERLPAGRRRRQVGALVDDVLAEFDADVLPFDATAADAYAALAARRERSGRPKPMADTMIAAICLANGVGLATRNVADFADAGLRSLVNPFEPSAAAGD